MREFNMKNIGIVFIIMLIVTGCSINPALIEVRDFMNQADSGNLKAQLELGEACETGNMSNTSFLSNESRYYLAAEYYDEVVPECSFKYYSLAANQGSPLAEYKLGIFYAEGFGVKQDKDLSISWLEKSASQGYLEAQAELGNVYYSGNGTGKDINKAIHWFTKAASQGSPESMFYLANIYRSGDVVSSDLSKSFQLMKKSAENSYTPAFPELAFMYAEGKGTTKNDSEFLKWIRAGAEKRDERSMYTLAGLYFNGVLVEQDYQWAEIWYDYNFKDPKYSDAKELKAIASSMVAQRKEERALDEKREALEKILAQDKSVCFSLGFKDKTDAMANCMLTQQVRRDQEIATRQNQVIEAARIESQRQIEAARVAREIAERQAREAAIKAEEEQARYDAFVRGMQGIIENSYQPAPVAQPPVNRTQTIRICDPNWVGDCR